MTEEILAGKLVVLRPATQAERRPIYDWLARSDVTQAMLGPPTFPDNPVPTWDEFCEDHPPHFFDGSAPQLGRSFVIVVNREPVGQVYYNDIEARGGTLRTELDMWMRSEQYCGRGFGSDALLTLCEHLARQFGVREFMLQPSARNPRAIRAYEKIGFARLPLALEEARAQWGPNDYFDSVYLVKTIPLGASAGSGAFLFFLFPLPRYSAGESRPPARRAQSACGYSG